MKKLVAVLSTAALVLSSNAMAAVDPAVTAAIDSGTADGTSIASALLVFAVAVGVVLYIKRKAG
jgi:hypothetical protein